MFDEINKTEEQETELPENLFEDDEPEINNKSEIDENIGREEKTEEKPQKETEEDQIYDARSRALAQVQRLSRDAGFSGPWSNLFRKYPSLTR
ncbi:MAG: hypothetical protein IJ299_03090, partial [Oscillospiraceae bacterium]|nr:hypothetical protein [Oscillospiraceae bacterium]